MKVALILGGLLGKAFILLIRCRTRQADFIAEKEESRWLVTTVPVITLSLCASDRLSAYCDGGAGLDRDYGAMLRVMS